VGFVGKTYEIRHKPLQVVALMRRVLPIHPRTSELDMNASQYPGTTRTPCDIQTVLIPQYRAILCTTVSCQSVVSNTSFGQVGHIYAFTPLKVCCDGKIMPLFAEFVKGVDELF
jgi:hypothetical protein